jgi:hypothetical protein
MECIGLHNKAEVHLGHKLAGPIEEEEEEVLYTVSNFFFPHHIAHTLFTPSPSLLTILPPITPHLYAAFHYISLHFTSLHF